MLLASSLSFLCEVFEERLVLICHHIVSLAAKKTFRFYVNKLIYLYSLSRMEEDFDSVLPDEGRSSLLLRILVFKEDLHF